MIETMEDDVVSTPTNMSPAIAIPDAGGFLPYLSLATTIYFFIISLMSV